MTREELRNNYGNPLAELIQRILNPANRSVVYIINILQDCKCADFPNDSGKQSQCLLSIVSEEHEVITKLREICLDSLPRLSIRLKCWSPILHVQAIWNFQLDAYRRKQVLLQFRTEVSTIAKDATVMELKLYIFKKMNVMNISWTQVIRVDNST